MNTFKLFLKFLIYKIRWRNKVQILWTANVSLRSSFEGMSKIYQHTLFDGRLGYGSYIGSHCELSANIGRFVSIASYVRCNFGRHPYLEPNVTTSPCFFSLNYQSGGTFATEQCYDEYRYADENHKIGVNIESDCWIGEGVFLLEVLI